MRTTIELDDDLLSEAKLLAGQRGASLGRVISDLARQSLAKESAPKMRNGFRLLTPKPGATRPDLHLINELRDEE
jgi:hypothetical protein